MSNRKKKFLRAYAEKQGISYAAAFHTVGEDELRSFHTTKYSITTDDGVTSEHGNATFSVQCKRCHAWIHCGDKPHSAICYCGQHYRVVFVSEPDWGLPQGPRCMDCGCEYSQRDGRTSWQVVNEWQRRCRRCSSKLAEARNERVEFADFLHRQAMMVCEAMLARADGLDDAEVKAAANAARTAMMDLATNHHPRALERARVGRDEHDPELEVAMKKSEAAFATLNAAITAAFEKRAAAADQRFEEQMKRSEEHTKRVAALLEAQNAEERELRERFFGTEN